MPSLMISLILLSLVFESFMVIIVDNDYKIILSIVETRIIKLDDKTVAIVYID